MIFNRSVISLLSLAAASSTSPVAAASANALRGGKNIQDRKLDTDLVQFIITETAPDGTKKCLGFHWDHYRSNTPAAVRHAVSDEDYSDCAEFEVERANFDSGDLGTVKWTGEEAQRGLESDEEENDRCIGIPYDEDVLYAFSCYDRDPRQNFKFDAQTGVLGLMDDSLSDYFITGQEGQDDPGNFYRPVRSQNADASVVAANFSLEVGLKSEVQSNPLDTSGITASQPFTILDSEGGCVQDFYYGTYMTSESVSDKDDEACLRFVTAVDPQSTGAIGHIFVADFFGTDSPQCLGYAVGDSSLSYADCEEDNMRQMFRVEPAQDGQFKKLTFQNGVFISTKGGFGLTYFRPADNSKFGVDYLTTDEATFEFFIV